MIFWVNPWESLYKNSNGIFVQRKGCCGKARGGKWALVMTSCLYARWIQMTESRRGCTPAQQSMISSNPLAFASRFSAVTAKVLISRHAPYYKHLFLVQKFYSRRTPRCIQGLLRKSFQFKRLGFPQIHLVPRKDAAQQVKQLSTSESTETGPQET